MAQPEVTTVRGTCAPEFGMVREEFERNFSELYADRAALAAHGRSEAMAAATPVLGELIAESELTIGEPVSAKGLPG